MKNFLVLASVLAAFSLGSCQRTTTDDEKTAKYWEQDGQKNLYASLRLLKNEKVAKNVILFLGDGMGMTTVTATRIYKGQKKRERGEEELLTFDQFPYVSLSKTYGIDRQTSDSANTATAYLCGVKANYGTIGVDGRVEYENCESSVDPSTHVPSILEWAQDKGKWTGFVTTTRVTHATPAGTYAHIASRNWESSTPSPKCQDIAYQLIHNKPGKDMHVIMGGGRRHFIPKTDKDVEGDSGSRPDSRNLLSEWRLMKSNDKKKAEMVFSASELKALNPNKVDYLVGLFHSDHLPYVAERPNLTKEYPTLPEMVEAAIKVLRKEEKGFVLLVEGGKIDIAHHLNWAKKALEEGVEFDKAIETAQQLTDPEETLIVVTADHSHTFTVGGNYQMRGTNILGIGGVSDVDNKTFTTLGYHNGPGYKKNSRDRNLTEEEAVETEFRQDSLFPMLYETHGAEDVPVYAKGPYAHLFHGVHEQSYIPYVMGYASCVGPNQDVCNAAMSVVLTRSSALLSVAIALFTYKWNVFY
ncbi:alkaline phosphatase-like [Argiope bruennichi]|uniref:alkaline phosphatase-like n=1 Tax=Argiope bruennichi TaxID=94029 RepID=UPI00249539CE|nr:alkaline phosphatase-like [Argiope bruennichi]